MLKGKTVLLGVSGGIAAYKMPDKSWGRGSCYYD